MGWPTREKLLRGFDSSGFRTTPDIPPIAGPADGSVSLRRCFSESRPSETATLWPRNDQSMSQRWTR